MGDIAGLFGGFAHPVGAVCRGRGFQTVGARLLYPPTYLPDLNPIALAFSKFKADPRKAAERSIPALRDRIGAILDTFSAAECQNFFRHAG